jgi:hypothetical protein
MSVYQYLIYNFICTRTFCFGVCFSASEEENSHNVRLTLQPLKLQQVGYRILSCRFLFRITVLYVRPNICGHSIWLPVRSVLQKSERVY